MGKGKGAPEFWVAVIKPGKILFELEGVPENVAIESLTQAANKLPIRCQVVSNNN
jgi:large subunit ribosomal protein L16